jgi:hypothetical protein
MLAGGTEGIRHLGLLQVNESCFLHLGKVCGRRRLPANNLDPASSREEIGSCQVKRH